MSNCKKCQSDDVKTLSETEMLKYKGAELPYQLAYSVCQNCEREFISTAQIKANDCRVREAKKIHDGLLTAAEIKQAREELGLTQAQASLVFGGGRNAFSKYERGEVAQSKAMDKLIRVCLIHKHVFSELCMDSEVVCHNFDGYDSNQIIPYHVFNEVRQQKIKAKTILKKTVVKSYG